MNEPKFVIIPEFIDKMDLTDSEKLLAGRIYALAAKKGYCYASNQFLAEDRGYSIPTVKRRVQKLVKAGAFSINVERKGKQITQRKLYIGEVGSELNPPNEVGSELIRGRIKTDPRGRLKTEPVSSRVVSSRVSSRISSKEDKAKARFGDSEINKILDCLKNELNDVPIDGSQKENRNYAKHFLTKLKKLCKEQGHPEDQAKDLGCFIIQAAHKGWHTKNATNMKYIYYNMGKIIQQTKQGGKVLKV